MCGGNADGFSAAMSLALRYSSLPNLPPAEGQDGPPGGLESVGREANWPFCARKGAGSRARPLPDDPRWPSQTQNRHFQEDKR